MNYSNDFFTNLLNDAKNLKILYAEDNHNVAQAVLKILNIFLKNVDLVQDGEEALEKFEKEKYDLILTDINMPKMNGIELIENIRKSDIQVPIVVISAYGDQEYLFKAIQAGIDGFILKPLDPEQFKRVITKALKNTLIYKEHKKNLALLNQYRDITNKASIISKTDPSGIITYVNDNFLRVSEYKKEELIGRAHSIIRHPDNPKEFYKQMWETISKKKQPWEGVIKNLSKSGKPYFVKTIIKPILDEEGKVIEYIALRNDISEIMSEKKQLLSYLESSKNSLLIMIQIENFDILDKFYDAKTIDRIEYIYGKTLLSHMPNSSTFSKIFTLGDGCFALIEEFKNYSSNYAQELIHKQLLKFINNVKESTIELENIEYDIRVIVSYSFGENNLYENVKYGIEKALDENKSLIFANSLVEEAQNTAKKNLETIQMVKNALDNARIVSFFQPIIENHSKEIVKYESLVRLINEKGEIISPYFFLDVSKKGSYYTKITKRVIENSFEILDHIKDNISINISVLDIENSNNKKHTI